MNQSATTIKDFKCRCGHSDARTDGVSIYFGIRKVQLDPIRLMWTCTRCKRQVEWCSTRTKNALQKHYG